MVQGIRLLVVFAGIAVCLLFWIVVDVTSIAYHVRKMYKGESPLSGPD